MSEGIKESKEAMVAMLEIAVVLADVFKDGVQIADAATIIAKIQEPAVMEKLSKGYEGVEKIPAELGDISLGEGLELGAAALLQVKDLLDKLRG